MKRKLVAAFLLAFAAWPLAQHALVRSHGVDPWRLFAWGMYSVPGPMRTVRVVVLDTERPPRLLSVQHYTAQEEDIVARFRTRRQALGSLFSAEGPARELLALHPDWDGVALPVLSLSLDRESASTVATIAQYTLWRDGAGREYAASRQTFASP